VLDRLPPGTPPPPQRSLASAVPLAEDQSSTRRCHGLFILARALGITAAGTALPGLGHLLLGRRRAGGCVLGIFLLTLGSLTVAADRLGHTGLLQIAVSTPVLARATVACILAALGWTAVVVWTYLLARPRALAVVYQVLGAVVAAALCLIVAIPLGIAANLAHTQRTLLDRVFAASSTAPAGSTPSRPLVSGAQIRQPRLNVLLLGSDAGPDRVGARTDTIMVASIDTRTAATTLIGLPRNIEHAPFPPGTPMAARFPDGFHNPRSPTSGDYLINNIAEYGREHPDLAPAKPTSDRGLNLLMSSVSYLLALPLDYYVEVDMAGLAAIMDALGGVTVDVGPVPLPIGGVTYDGRHVTPDGYVPAGVQHLNGNQALWFARSRRNSDDYNRMARQRCLIDAVLAQKRPIDVATHFQSVAEATANSVTTSIPQTLLPALLTLAEEHRPLHLQAISFDPGLPDPDGPHGRFDPAEPDIPYMRRLVSAAVFAAPAPSPIPSASLAPAPQPSPQATTSPSTTATMAPACRP
jgi:LCP family protein required for cell wall assembly